jgi:hypothetical protein
MTRAFEKAWAETGIISIEQSESARARAERVRESGFLPRVVLTIKSYFLSLVAALHGSIDSSSSVNSQVWNIQM